VAARWKGVEGVRKRERRMRFPKNRKAPTVTKSRSFSSRGVTNEKKARRKPGRVDRGSESAFRLLSRVVETRRARPKPRRASARARTVDRCHLIHRARHAGRVHDARAHLLACRDASKTFGGFLRQRGGNVRDSRMGFGVRFFVFRRRERKKATCGRRACGLRTSPDGSVGGAEPAFAQALVPFDDDVVRLKERQVRALLVDLRDRLSELGVVLRRWDAKRATMGTRRGRSVDAGRDAARRGTRRAHRGRGFVVTNAIELDTRRRRVSRRDTTRRRLGRACRTCVAMCRKRRWRGDERARTMVAARGRRRDACARRSMRRPHASVGVCGRASRSPKRRLRSVCAAVAARALECREPSADCAGGRRERSVPRGSMRFREKNRETDFSSRPDRPPAVTLKDTRHRSLTDRRDERARTTVAARGRRRDKKLASKLACARRSMRIDPITQVALITPGSPPSP